MYSAASACVLGAAALLFAVFLAEELDLRRAHPANRVAWTPAFLPLILLALGAAAVAAFRCAAAVRRRPAPAKIDDVDEPPPLPSARPWLRVAAVDAAIDGALALLFLFFIHTLVGGLNQLDDARAPPWTAFVAAEIVFYLLFAAFAWLTLIGALRTHFEYHLETSDSCWTGVCRCFTVAYRDAQRSAEDIRRDQNTRSAIGLRTRYQNRQPYQNNKLVYLCTLDVMPNVWLDGLHIALLLLHAVGVLVAGMLLFIRLRELAAAASTAPLATSTVASAAPATGAAGLQLPPVGQVQHHVVHALHEWHGRVMPLAVVFAPLFVTQGLLLLYTAPQAVSYLVQQRPLADWLQASAYTALLAMLVLFEALLAVRIDHGVLQHASWHNTFAPLYAGFGFLLGAVGCSLLFIESPKRAASSRWGVLAPDAE